MLQQEKVEARAEVTPAQDATKSGFLRTQQRFCKRIGGNYYLVQVIQTSQCNTCVSYYNGKTGAKVFTKQLHKRWLQALSPSVRNVLLTKSKWFRDHAENILSTAACTPHHKPTRRPPSVPRFAVSGRKRPAMRSLADQLNKGPVPARDDTQKIDELTRKVAQLEEALRRRDSEDKRSDKLTEAEELIMAKDLELEKKSKELAELNTLLEKTVEGVKGFAVSFKGSSPRT